MKHRGTRGGPAGDDELPPLDPRLHGLKGAELLRAALALAKPETTGRTTPRPFAPPRPPGRPEKATPAWTPHDAIPQQHAQAHWADDIPDGPEPEEEDWR